MKTIFDEYDFSFAVQIRSIMLYEKWEDNEERKKKVWDPTRKFLEEFAKSNPQQIICFFGREFKFPNKANCLCKNIFISNHLHQVAYLCTVLNRTAAISYYTNVVGIKGCPKDLCALKIARDQVYYLVPSNKEDIDEVEVIQAIKRYLQSYKGAVPKLAKATTCLLSPELGELLDDNIRQLAKKQARSKNNKNEK